MDEYYRYGHNYHLPIYGTDIDADYRDELLDLLYYRCSKGRETPQNLLLDQTVSDLDSDEDVPEAWQDLFQDLARQSVDAQEALTWERLWDYEDKYNQPMLSEKDSAEIACFGEGGGDDEDFCVISPLEIPSYLQPSPLTSDSTSSLSDSSLTMVLSQPATRSERIIDPEDPNEGSDLGLSDSERPGLRPQYFDFLPPDHIPKSPPIPTTRAETITVTLGNVEVPYTGMKQNMDYRNVPSPIMQPRSPDQRRRQPSLKEFRKGPQRRDFVEECVATNTVVNIPQNEEDYTYPSPLPPPQHAEFTRRAVNLMDHPSNSDISLFHIGSPVASIASARRPPSFDLPVSDAASSPPIRSYTNHPNTERQFIWRLNGVCAPAILSVDAPVSNDTSWSEPSTPRSGGSGKSSLGGVFALDEELDPNSPHRS
ncbi:hypothetical protein BGW36DRAFT_433161 [Talaromyces proteolyticus]|uniref:Uncharacterized protein n=1 Tax=Talaromyces proteolyticus TaxID=1131652 RepID=A0AAD4KES1_9EURO|nr:uncharacterized protein BGW36DRAFT_433161 [Talaromyces proteolyticus]KAH8690210.1 hypothetical protein BGW36DRAFT_433161 [Talaromyces proteolyticus]